MVRSFRDVIRGMLPLGKSSKQDLEKAKEALSPELFEEAERLLREERVKFTFDLIPEGDASSIPKVPLVQVATKGGKEPQDEDQLSFNQASRKEAEEGFYGYIADHAREIFRSSIGPSIVGFDAVKDALALQLFAEEPIHILMIGDPGTGKTVLLQSAAELSPISSFGLGSGTSGAGLAVTVKGKNVQPGLLAMAHDGLCCIDELNLMEKGDRAPLYSAMEKGFFTYDKGGHHYRFDAMIRLSATANPKDSRFQGTDPASLRKEFPFDAALISRFHLIFVMRKPDREAFMNIAERIVQGKKDSAPISSELAKQYVQLARAINVSIPKTLEKEITTCVEDLKSNEAGYLTEVAPRTVVGLLRAVKASARMQMRTKATTQDLEWAKYILLSSLRVDWPTAD